MSRTHFNIISHLRPRYSYWSYSIKRPHQNSMRISDHSNAPCQSDPNQTRPCVALHRSGREQNYADLSWRHPTGADLTRVTERSLFRSTSYLPSVRAARKLCHVDQLTTETSTTRRLLRNKTALRGRKETRNEQLLVKVSAAWLHYTWGRNEQLLVKVSAAWLHYTWGRNGRKTFMWKTAACISRQILTTRNKHLV